MARFVLVLFLAGLSAASAGCSSCCTPFDYDGPVSGPYQTDAEGRMGSAFGGQVVAGETITEEPTPYYSGH